MDISLRNRNFTAVRKCKTELKSNKAQNEELRRTLELMEGRIRARVSDLSLSFSIMQIVYHTFVT